MPQAPIKNPVRSVSKPILALAIIVVLLLGGILRLALHPPSQEAPQKKEPARSSTGHPPIENHRPPAPEMLSAPRKPSLVVEDAPEKSELARAQQLLASTNEHQRIEGLKLLGAYPSPLNEVILVGYLKSQENPKIRGTAALGLSTLGKPSVSTIDTLLSALEDSCEDVRFSALSTLEDYLIFAKQNSAIDQQIREGLRVKLQAKRLQADIQKDIDDIVHDR
jgi:HEAT repeat protein